MEVYKELRKQIFKTITSLLMMVLLICITLFSFHYLYIGSSVAVTSLDTVYDKSNAADYEMIPTPTLTQQEQIDLLKQYNVAREDFNKPIVDIVNKYNIDITRYQENTLREYQEKYDFTYTIKREKIVKADDKVYYITDYTGDINTTGAENNATTGHVRLTQNPKRATDLQLDNKTYTIDGTVAAPHFVYLYNAKYAASNMTTTNIGVQMTSHDYQAVTGDEQTTFFIKLANTNDRADFEQYIVNTQSPAYFQKSETTKVLARNTIDTNKQLAIISVIICTTILLLVFIISINNKLDTMLKTFGILIILGVKRSRIIAIITVIYTIIFATAVLIGNVIGSFFDTQLLTQFNSFFTIPLANVAVVDQIILFSVGLTILFALIIAVLVSIKINREALMLIAPMQTSKYGKLFSFIKQKIQNFPLQFAMKVTYAFSKMSRLLIVFVGSVICCILLLSAFGVYTQQVNNIEDVKSQTTFKTLYYIEPSTVIHEGDEGVTQFQTYIGSESERDTYQVVALDETGHVYPQSYYQQTKGNMVIIPKKYAEMKHLKVNDTIQMKIGKVQYSLTISGINTLNLDGNFYIGKAGHDVAAASMVYCQETSSCLYPDDIKSVSKADVDAQLISNVGQLSVLITGITVFAMLIVFVVFVLIASLNVEGILEDYKVLRLMSYRKWQIIRYTTTIYCVTILVAVAISGGIFIGVRPYIEQLLNTNSGLMYLGINFQIATLIVSTCIIIGLYYTIFITVAYQQLKRIFKGELHEK